VSHSFLQSKIPESLKYGAFAGEMRLYLMWASNQPEDRMVLCVRHEGEIRRQLGSIFHELARQKECQILEGHLMPDHAHMRIAIPPKQAVASVIGFINGKSAITIARMRGKERNFAREHFWARGYAVSTLGFSEDDVRRYIRKQKDSDGSGRF
jgi:putative transposase